MSGFAAAEQLNPYASPTIDAAREPAAARPAAKPGSVAIVLSGLVLLLVGYFTSNLLVMAELYDIDWGPGASNAPSPFASVLPTAMHQWLAYAVAAAAFVVGAVMVGSQRFNPMTIVVYVMCPLAG